VISASTNVALSSVSSGATGTTARAREVDATDLAWRLVATAVCANVTTETPTANYAGGGLWLETSTCASLNQGPPNQASRRRTRAGRVGLRPCGRGCGQRRRPRRSQSR